MTERTRIVLTGAEGFVGRTVRHHLEAAGHEVVRLKSRSSGKGGYDIQSGHIDKEVLRGCQAVVHLAGAPIARRWNERSYLDIIESRVASTDLIARAMAELLPAGGPAVLISMSGINRYGTRRDEVLTESSAVREEGFLAKVTSAWEEAAGPAIKAGVRTVFLRTGMVLGASGGPLKLMLPAFRLGLGGPIAGGAQRVSWITVDDLAGMILWALGRADLSGPINATAPGHVTQREFARALGAALGRPAFLPLPGWALAPLGGFAKETVLADLAVLPERAMAMGFKFRCPKIEDAFRECLRR
ncbi:MAG: TIGR01777 family oxidoreductase [Opitutales bacterium]|jgi:uncharacterized protein (TIGR01777 family)